MVIDSTRYSGKRDIIKIMDGFGVYSITIKTDHGDMIYIGSTSKGFKQRMSEHLSCLNHNKHCNKHLQRLWCKYQNFSFSVVEVCSDPKEVAIREQWHIEHTEKSVLINNGPAYPSPRYGMPVSEETRKKQSEAAQKRASNPQERERLRLIATGISPSTETRRKLSETSGRFYRTPEGREFMSRINKGKTVSSETRAKLSLANKGKKPSQKCIDAVRRANTGRKPSPEALIKQSVSMKNFYLEHPEKRKKISADLKKRVITEETREKLRQAALLQHSRNSKNEITS